MRALTYATDSDGYYPLLQSSALRFGFALDVLGWGERWSGMATKMIRYHDRLSQYPASEVVMLVDAYDVVFAAPVVETEKIFESMQLPYLFSAQRYFPKSRFWRRLADQVMGLGDDGHLPNRFETERSGRPCMGALMGYAGALTELFSRLIASEARLNTRDDQKLLNLHLQKFPEEVHIDRECQIFQNLWRNSGVGSAGRFDPRVSHSELRVLPTARLENRQTKTHPQVIHAPMNLNIDPLLAAMGYRLDEVKRISRLRYLRYGVVPHVKVLFERELKAMSHSRGGPSGTNRS